VEDRTDVYALVGSDAVGLKHRWVVTERNGVHVNSCLCEVTPTPSDLSGYFPRINMCMARGKKGKLEVKIRPPAVAADGAEDFGVELWKKFKLGKGGKGDDGEGGRCMVPAQQAELERILTEHGLLDARVQHGACVRAWACV